MAKRRLLEPGDELGLPWDSWADGRVWRLRKGRDFYRSSRAVQEAAENAARRLHMAVKTVVERTKTSLSVWVQFADHEIEVGEPCPCGGTDIRRVNRFVGICDSCSSTLILSRPKRKDDAAETAALERERLRQERLSQQRAARERRAQAERQRREERARTERRRAIERGFAAQRREEEAARKHAIEEEKARSREASLAALTPKERAAREKEAERLRAVLERERARLAEVQAKRRRGEEKAEPSATDPLTRLSSYADVRLFLHDRGLKRERYIGHGHTKAGVPMLLLVRFPLRDGRRIPDASRPGEDRHVVRAVPMEPFAGEIDFSPLMSREPDLRITPSESSDEVGRSGD